MDFKDVKTVTAIWHAPETIWDFPEELEKLKIKPSDIDQIWVKRGFLHIQTKDEKIHSVSDHSAGIISGDFKYPEETFCEDEEENRVFPEDISNQPKLEKLDGKLGFLFGGSFITNPRESECGRFDVDPIHHYGLTQDQLIELSAEE